MSECCCCWSRLDGGTEEEELCDFQLRLYCSVFIERQSLCSANSAQMRIKDETEDCIILTLAELNPLFELTNILTIRLFWFLMGSVNSSSAVMVLSPAQSQLEENKYIPVFLSVHSCFYSINKMQVRTLIITSSLKYIFVLFLHQSMMMGSNLHKTMPSKSRPKTVNGFNLQFLNPYSWFDLNIQWSNKSERLFSITPTTTLGPATTSDPKRVVENLILAIAYHHRIRFNIHPQWAHLTLIHHGQQKYEPNCRCITESVHNNQRECTITKP